MSIGEWQPEEQRETTSIAPDKVAILIALGRQDVLRNLVQQLDMHTQQWLTHAIHAGRKPWTQVCDTLSDDDIIHLMQVLTIAEMQLPGCTVGEKSPVIYLNRTLKERGRKLNRDELAWIKQHSDNRFIPNGPIL
jgi:hypothetical protein